MCGDCGKCLWCDGPTKVFRSSGRHQKFCCAAHRMRYERSGGRKRETPTERQCLQCGTVVYGRMFCSSACSSRFRYDHPRGNEYKCRNCGRLFIPRKADRTTYCSVKCCAEWREKRGAERRHDCSHVSYCKVCCAALKGKGRVACKEHLRDVQLQQQRDYYYEHHEYATATLTCAECEKVFTVSRYLNERRRYCSEKCSTRALKRETSNHRKRARKNGVEYDSTVKLHELFVRDGGRCQVCGCKVKRTRKHSKRRATLGHIKALSKGGSHTWDNVQLECWVCNTYMGDKEHGQRRLSF